jgi:exopolyphosphatase / guanosine-5'-triphosphate,3'-diphosphate pyrophosphatase
VPAAVPASDERGDPTDPSVRIPTVRVAVIDVGSNSVRLLVAAVKRRGQIREIARDRVYLRLGDDAYNLSRIGDRKLDELADVAERYARLARASGAARLETIVTAPGRQASNADLLLELLEDATRSPVVLLTAEDEGRLAWDGAVSFLADPPGSVAVVDLGGGSCEIAIGSPAEGPTWVCSRDAGALRVTRAFLPATRPTQRNLDDARDAIHDLLDGVEPTHPDLAFAVGGTARALGKIIGPRFGARKLDALAERLVRERAAVVTTGLDITPDRIETLLGGTLVLSEIAQRLDAKLEIGRGGLREGAALALARVESAAA